MPAIGYVGLIALFGFLTCLPGQSHAADAQIGPRPFYLVEKMKEGPLRNELAQCKGPFRKTDFSIAHRGAPLQFPEHSKESYQAAAVMGAGVIECDVTFTKDRQLVCRHSQCDLHTTTNILSVPALAAKCTQPFVPADPATGKKASAKCCTSDITLAEFKSLSAKMDASNANATNAADYQNGTPRWRTDLYAASGTLMTHAESIALVKSLGAKFTPELKEPEVPMPFDGDYTQEKYATQMLDEYRAAGIPPADVFAQSFRLADVLYWVKTAPEFAKQAVYLDGRYENAGFDHAKPETWKPSMAELKTSGVTHVPYRGAGPMMQDLVAGHVPVAFDGLGSSANQIQSGALRALAVAAPARSSAIPDVPTAEQAGLKGYEVSTWYGLFAPKGTPPDIIKKMEGEVRSTKAEHLIVSTNCDIILISQLETGRGEYSGPQCR